MKQLLVALLSLLICAPSNAGATLDGKISAAQEQDANGNGLTDEAISRELSCSEARKSPCARR
jgi:hypothetical protein